MNGFHAPWRPRVRLMLGVADLLQAAPARLQERVDLLVAQAFAGGITLVDTADAYAPRSGPFGLGETVVRDAVDRLRPSTAVVVMTKGGHTRTPDGGWATDGSAGYLVGACRDSLRRLRIDRHEVYTLHRPDPATEFAESLVGLATIVADGLARRIALSNVSVAQILLAREVLGDSLVAVQNELSLTAPDGLAEVALCEQLGLTYFAWAPLGGARAAGQLGELVPEAAALARAYGHTPQQVALAWLIAVSEVVVPVVGVNRPASLQASLAATSLPLSAEETSALTDAARLRRGARHAGR
jgi:aryl-alcohol dehydrogenase-like predicted oxidoreductase